MPARLAYFIRLQKYVIETIELVFDSKFFRNVTWVLEFGGRQLRKRNVIVNNIATAIEKSPDVAPILQQTAISNLHYAGAAIAAGMFFPSVRALVPISATMLTVLEGGALTTWCVYLVFSNSLYNFALAKSLLPYLPVRTKDSSMPESKSNPREKLEANIANSVLYLCLLMMASGSSLFTSSLPELLQTPGLLLQAIAYGYALAGMQYSAHGIAANDSSAVLNNNKIYYISIGAALIYTVKKTTALIENLAHIAPNFFLEDAIFSLAWQQSIMIVMLQEPTEDYFRYPREVVQQYISNQVKNFLKSLKEATTTSNFIQTVNKNLASDEAKYILSLRPVQMVVDVHHEELVLVLEWILWVRANKADKLADWLEQRLPNWEMLKEFRLFTNIVKQQSWEQTSLLVNAHLGDIATRREIGEGMIRIMGEINVRFDDEGEVKKENSTDAITTSQLLESSASSLSLVVPQSPTNKATSPQRKQGLFATQAVIPSLSAGEKDDFLDVAVYGDGSRPSVSFQSVTGGPGS